MKKIFITNKILNVLFKDFYSHIGWSNFYGKYVIVEPIWYFKLQRNCVTHCKCVDNLIFDFQNSFGELVAKIIDENASEFIEQAMIIEKDYLFVCDNPILFPYNRLENFQKYLVVHKDKISEIDGLIHYHINEKELNKSDIYALSNFFNKIIAKKAANYLGIVISQRDPVLSFDFISKESGFIDNMFNELKQNSISFSGKIFYNNSIEDCNISFQ